MFRLCSKQACSVKNSWAGSAASTGVADSKYVNRICFPVINIPPKRMTCHSRNRVTEQAMEIS